MSTPSRILGGNGYLGTPSDGYSRDTSTVPRSGSSNKRPAPDVIDLTLSDDDEPAARPVKRANYGSGSYSNSGNFSW